MIQITTHEQYQLVTANWNSMSPGSFHENQQTVNDALAEQPNCIIDISNMETVTEAVQIFLNNLQNEIRKADGSLVLSEGDKKVAEQLEGMGYVCIPSLNEAIDYIFMEQIEKMMGDEDAE